MKAFDDMSGAAYCGTFLRAGPISRRERTLKDNSERTTADDGDEKSERRWSPGAGAAPPRAAKMQGTATPN